MKKIRELRIQKLLELDDLYNEVHDGLLKGFAEQPFNKKGQRSQSTLLSRLKVKAEEIQELNRTLKLVSQK